MPRFLWARALLGLAADRLGEGGDRLVVPVQVLERAAQVDERLGVTRPEPDRLLEARHRGIVPPLRRQGDAQVMVRLGIRRPQPQRLVVGGDGLGDASPGSAAPGPGY